jgi:broad specificity phosphatase PhoE
MSKSKFTRVYLVRHGKTAWNAEGKLQGRGDSPLLESSFPTIRRLADTIRPVRFDLFLRSPLKRVEESYQSMLPLDISQSRVEPALMEISFGDYNGRKLAEVPAEVLRRREADKWSTPWPNGESYRDVFDRIQPVVQEITQTAGTIGILAHETVNKLLLASLLGWTGNRVFSIKHPNHVIYKIENGNACSLSVSDDWHSGIGYTEL